MRSAISADIAHAVANACGGVFSPPLVRGTRDTRTMIGNIINHTLSGQRTMYKCVLYHISSTCTAGQNDPVVLSSCAANNGESLFMPVVGDVFYQVVDSCDCSIVFTWLIHNHMLSAKGFWFGKIWIKCRFHSVLLASDISNRNGNETEHTI